MASVAELIRRLERVWLEPSTASVEQLAGMLAERQNILGEIQKADTRTLSPKSKAALRERMDRVRERDGKLMTALATRQESLEKALAGLMRGRAAARGYGANVEAMPAVFDREG